GDSLEYRVVTTTSKAPLAPDFWLDHSFNRTGVVSREVFQIDLPVQRARLHVNPATPGKVEKSGEGESARETYLWEVDPSKLKAVEPDSDAEDIALTSYSSWAQLAQKLFDIQHWYFATKLWSDVEALTGSREEETSPKFLYNFVAHKIKTVDLPFAQESFV